MATIQGIYIALFGRPADPAGLAFFNEATNNGADLTAIGDLASTDEYQQRFTGMSNEEIINSIYQSLFERDGEPDGIQFFLDRLEDGTYNINNIAIAILDGAQGDDLATVNAKIAAANIFTERLDLQVEIDAYDGAAAAQIGREFINAVDKDDAGTGAEADAAILLLLGDEGQEPGNGGGGGGVSFSAIVVNGELQFINAADDDILVNVNDGKLVFQQGSRTFTLTDDSWITSIDPNVSLKADASEDSSDVVAYISGLGWQFINASVYGENADGLDFYSAINQSSNVLLLDGFDISSLDGELTWEAVFEFLGGQIQNAGLSELVSALDFLAHAGSANTNIAVAATSGANTSLNGIFESLGLSIELPNIGMPIMLEGEGSNVLSASGNDGYILVGNIDAVHDAASDLVEALGAGDTPNYELILASLNDNDSNDLIRGSAGNDVIIGLGGDDELTGNGGDDIFVSINVPRFYSDDTDTVTDFDEGDTLVISTGGRSELTWEQQENGAVVGYYEKSDFVELMVLEGYDAEERGLGIQFLTGVGPVGVFTVTSPYAIERGVEDFAGSSDTVLTLIGETAYGSVALTPDETAIFTSSANDTGPFTRFDGYRTDSPDVVTTSIDIVIDDDHISDEEGFSYSVAANTTGGVHMRDFIFHVARDENGDLVVSANNNSSGAPYVGSNATVIGPGEYTFEHKMFENSNGDLEVRMRVIDKTDGSVDFEAFLTQPTDDFLNFGGNRYGWFTNIDVNEGIQVDNWAIAAQYFENNLVA